jgi:hypothetical protein
MYDMTQMVIVINIVKMEAEIKFVGKPNRFTINIKANIINAW